MPEHRTHRLLRPETLTALCIIAAAAAFLIPAFDMRPITALLPAAMLVGLMVLSALLLVADQRKATAGGEAQAMTNAPKRVLGAFLLIIGYALSTDFIGFYVSSAIAIPLVTFAFGYRSPIRLAAATIIVLATIYLIFDFGMHQEFPSGRLWRN